MAGPLYTFDIVTNSLETPTPVDTLFLTRYRGPILKEALGPKFASLDTIAQSYDQMSSFTEPAEDGLGGTWTYEQWNKKLV